MAQIQHSLIVSEIESCRMSCAQGSPISCHGWSAQAMTPAAQWPVVQTWIPCKPLPGHSCPACSCSWRSILLVEPPEYIHVISSVVSNLYPCPMFCLIGLVIISHLIFFNTQQLEAQVHLSLTTSTPEIQYWWPICMPPHGVRVKEMYLIFLD